MMLNHISSWKQLSGKEYAVLVQVCKAMPKYWKDVAAESFVAK